MHVSWTFTGDGIITLAVGMLAFAGVIVTIFWSSRNVREQIKASALDVQRELDAQKVERQDEVQRQRSAIASALLAEIRDFRTYHVETFVSTTNNGISVKVWDMRFHVYESNTNRIGELGGDACKAVVHFYDRALDHLGAIRRYLEMEHEEPYAGESPEDKNGRQVKFFLRAVSGRLDELKEAAGKAESALARVARPQNL